MMNGALMFGGPGEWDWNFCGLGIRLLADQAIIDCNNLLKAAKLDFGESQSKNLLIWKKAKNKVIALIQERNAAAKLRIGQARSRRRLRSKLGPMAASLAVSILERKKNENEKKNKENAILAARRRPPAENKTKKETAGRAIQKESDRAGEHS